MSLTSVEGESEVGFGAGRHHHHHHHTAPLHLRAAMAETGNTRVCALQLFTQTQFLLHNE